MVVYVGYCRVSTKKQDNASQRAKLIRHAKSKGRDIIRIYEEKESGKKSSRPILARAIEYAKENNAVLLIPKLDRLSRSVKFLFEVKDSGLEIECANLPELNTLTLGLFATIAQYELEQISERTKEKLAYKAKHGTKSGRKIGREKGCNASPAALEASLESRRQSFRVDYERIAETALTLKTENGFTIRQLVAFANSPSQQWKTPRGGKMNNTFMHRLLNAGKEWASMRETEKANIASQDISFNVSEKELESA